MGGGVRFTLKATKADVKVEDYLSQTIACIWDSGDKVDKVWD